MAGSIAPKRRIGKTRKRLRRSHHALSAPGMVVCPNCGELKLAHKVCSVCGYYDGRKVVEVKVAAAEEEAAPATKAKPKKAKK